MATENEELEDLELEEEQSEEVEEQDDTEETVDDDSDKEDSDDDSDDDTVTLKGKDLEDYKKYQAKKKQRQQFADKANKGKPKTDLPTQQDNTDSILKAVAAIRGIEDNEIVVLEKEADALGIPFIKYVKSNSGKTMLETIRNKAKKAEANPTITSKSPVYKKYTQDDLSKMSSAELEKILPKA